MGDNEVLAALVISGGVELAKVLVIAFFAAAAMAKLTPVEIDKLYLEEKVKFLAKDPNKIPTGE